MQISLVALTLIHHAWHPSIWNAPERPSQKHHVQGHEAHVCLVRRKYDWK